MVIILTGRANAKGRNRGLIEMDKIKKNITDGRDFLGITSLIVSSLNIGLIDKLYEIAKTEPRTIKEISSLINIEAYFLDPILDVLTHVGIVNKTSRGYKLQNPEQFEYHRKMLDALPLYHLMSNYFRKASGNRVEIPFHFNEFITSASSRLAFPAMEIAVEKFPYLKNEKIKVLDIGCGIGEYLIQFSGINKNMTGYGIEMDIIVAEKAAKRIISNNLENRIQILNANFLDLSAKDLPDNFDIAMMNHIYHVVGDDISYSLTDKSYRHLKEGGLFLNLEICRDYPGKDNAIPILFDALMRFLYTENKGKGFRKDEIEKIMKDCNYKVNENDHIHIRDFDTPNMVYFVGRK